METEKIEKFDVKVWLSDYIKKLLLLFKDRIYFAGLQGSYGRKEAAKDSDIDVVVILNQVNLQDLKAYSKMLDEMPQREKACGFISGKSELMAWEPSDLFQFFYDTIPLIGSLEGLRDLISEEDVRRAIHIGACNVYHMCAHNFVHEKDWEILKGLYKSAAFTLQAIGYQKSGQYQHQKKYLAANLSNDDRQILEDCQTYKLVEAVSSKEFDKLSENLLNWSSKWILKAADRNVKLK